MRAAASFGLIGTIILALGLVLTSHSNARQIPEEPQLYLHRGTIDARTDMPAAPTTASASPAPGPYSIVQFRAPISAADRAALEETGVQLLEYLPDYAYLVRGGAAELSAAAHLRQVFAHTSFTLADKLAPALLRALARSVEDIGSVRVFGWPGDTGELARDLERIGVEQPITADSHLLLQMANLESVRWIEPVLESRILNDQARAIMNVDPVWQNRQLYGAGQVIAVADSGLDTGDLNTVSADFIDRIMATHVLSDGAAWDDNHGHGTHVAGSIAGAGVESGANPAQHDYDDSYAGVAPEAQLVIQAFEVMADGQIVGLDPDYYQLYDQAYEDGARLHSDSWGDVTGPDSDAEAKYGGYPFGSHRTDQFLWDHPNMAIFVAAGNEGRDGKDPIFLGMCGDSDGVVDPDSLLAPGTAKNVITVGASESVRAAGGFSTLPWLFFGMAHPSGEVCFSAVPIAADLPSNDPDGMAAFSSRGPTDDGRTKPDIVAPGTNIISSRSVFADELSLWGAHDANYSYSGGTSMATPLTAGAGALVREWLGQQGSPNASAAAIKAVMLNTAYDMAPGQYFPTTVEITYTRPNTVTGWGRVDLGFMDAPPPYLLWLDDHSSGLETGQTVSYHHTGARPLEVRDSGQPLRVMLAWTDPPASLSAAVQLVNDLDLVVTGPGGATYYGNGMSSGDRRNNAEGVIIPNPPLGLYEVEIRAFNIPSAAQPYALAVGGPLGHLASMKASKTPSASVGDLDQTITYTYRVTNTGTLMLTGVEGVDDRLGQVTFSPATLAPDGVTTGALTYTLRASDLPGPLVNTVRISATTVADTPEVVSTEVTAAVEVLSPAAVTVTKTPSPSSVEISQTITYTYRLTNTGTVPLIDLTGTDDKLGTVVFTPNTLAPDQNATATLTYTVGVLDWPGPVTNTVRVTGTAQLDVPVRATSQAVASVNVTGPAAISVTKTASAFAAEAGRTITYTYRVTNSGAVTLSGIVGVDDKLGAVVFNPNTLAPDESVVSTLNYTVQESDLPGPIVNTVTVSGTATSGLRLTAASKDEATVFLNIDNLIFLPVVVKQSTSRR
jgi:uncharacterized repeat protein (TIGR01451 family)